MEVIFVALGCQISPTPHRMCHIFYMVFENKALNILPSPGHWLICLILCPSHRDVPVPELRMAIAVIDAEIDKANIMFYLTIAYDTDVESLNQAEPVSLDVICQRMLRGPVRRIGKLNSSELEWIRRKNLTLSFQCRKCYLGPHVVCRSYSVTSSSNLR